MKITITITQEDVESCEDCKFGDFDYCDADSQERVIDRDCVPDWCPGRQENKKGKLR